MLSHSNNYPIVTQYDDSHIAVPFGIVAVETGDPPQPGYEFNLLIVPASNMTSQAAYINSVQAMLDVAAQTRGYDGILSACTYATSSNTQFAAEGQACVYWRDSVWSKCYEILAEVQSGTRQPPTITELLIEMPNITWT